VYSLEEIYTEASEDADAIHTALPTGVSVINYGVKLQKFSTQIELLNCGRGGDYFRELTSKEYKFFFKYGWREGGIRLSMGNCKRKLGMIEERMREEINTRKNDKHIQKLKVQRENIVKKYAGYNNKLTKIKSNGKEKEHF
tara:strand:+ start:9189 stop:9611 length:423 start_codon:yes stop_codon:yes gene_type:complete